MPGSEVLWGRLALPGDQGLCPRSRGIDQLSRATQARVHAPAVSTPSPGRCGLSSDACGVDHMSQKTCDRVRSPTVSSGFPRRLGPGSKDHRARPALPCYLGLCARHHSSTSCPGCLVPGSEGPRFHQVSRASSAQVQGLAGFTCCPARRGRGSKSQLGRPTPPGDLRPGPWACGIDHLSRDTRARFRGPAESTSSNWRLGPVNEGPWCRPVLPNNPDPVPRARGVDQLS